MNKEEYERLQENVIASGQTQQSFIINALAGVIIAPRLALDGEMQMWVDAEDSLDVW